MTDSIIVEGKTTNEAIEKGLKQLNVSKDKVDIKVIEEEKRSFYSILSPRVVKVELTIKDNKDSKKQEYNEEKKLEDTKKRYEPKLEELEQARENVIEFLNKFLKEEINKDVRIEENKLLVVIEGENLNYLIGYRGETINAIQTILFSIANKKSNGPIKVGVDIAGYREKREKTLKDLAEKVARTVIRTGKSIALEPMTAYERKIIHSQLHDHNKIKTISKGEEPNRKIIIMLK